ncbi:MAG: hypothetical protein ABJO30_14400 [Hyphomicrobiales bacterium]
MMSNNKILTVSYGTFSCTLEGFDDSFGTMKVIAEYFRDLAHEDRYFGAQPPQPDAEMLSRIAQKETSRRVEVREHEGQIVLSAAETAEVIQDDPPAPAPKTNLKAEALIAAEAARAAQATAKADAHVAEEVRIKEAQETAEHEELKRLEAERAETERLEAERQEAEPEADKEAQDVVPSRDLAAEMPEADAFFAPSTPELAEDDANDAPLPQAETAQSDSIAAKLQRIRAVVSQAETENDDDDFSEDQHADVLDTQTSEIAEEVVEAAVDVADVTEAEVESAKATDTAVEDFDISNFSVDAEETSEDTVATIETVQAEAIADIKAASDADDVTDAAEDVAYDDNDRSSILARLESRNVDIDEATLADISESEEVSTEDDVAAQRVARVIKVKRADLEAAIAQDDLEEIDDDASFEDEAWDLGETTLTDTDEAELARDLASVEADIEDLDDISLFSDATFEEASTPPEIDESEDDDDDDLSRLLAKTDQKMNNEEGKQSRDAFAHLRAAVAAKNADSALDTPSAEEEDPYRTDLATTVEPPRSSAQTNPSEGSQPVASAAPLKLVVEQRVDASSEDTGEPVQPSPAALQDAKPNREPSNFSEFAEDMGASELPDLLEAAASYMSFVEGHEQFSRPQLMNAVRSIEAEGFNREEGLRSFGKLLRDGKIEKTKGGRFTATSDIGFQPAARAVG